MIGTSFSSCPSWVCPLSSHILLHFDVLPVCILLNARSFLQKFFMKFYANCMFYWHVKWILLKLTQHHYSICYIAYLFLVHILKMNLIHVNNWLNVFMSYFKFRTVLLSDSQACSSTNTSFHVHFVPPSWIFVFLWDHQVSSLFITAVEHHMTSTFWMGMSFKIKCDLLGQLFLLLSLNYTTT